MTRWTSEAKNLFWWLIYLFVICYKLFSFCSHIIFCIYISFSNYLLGYDLTFLIGVKATPANLHRFYLLVLAHLFSLIWFAIACHHTFIIALFIVALLRLLCSQTLHVFTLSTATDYPLIISKLIVFSFQNWKMNHVR